MYLFVVLEWLSEFLLVISSDTSFKSIYGIKSGSIILDKKLVKSCKISKYLVLCSQYDHFSLGAYSVVIRMIKLYWGLKLPVFSISPHILVKNQTFTIYYQIKLFYTFMQLVLPDVVFSMCSVHLKNPPIRHVILLFLWKNMQIPP